MFDRVRARDCPDFQIFKPSANMLPLLRQSKQRPNLYFRWLDLRGWAALHLRVPRKPLTAADGRERGADSGEQYSRSTTFGFRAGGRSVQQHDLPPGGGLLPGGYSAHGVAEGGYAGDSSDCEERRGGRGGACNGGNQAQFLFPQADWTGGLVKRLKISVQRNITFALYSPRVRVRCLAKRVTLRTHVHQK